MSKPNTTQRSWDNYEGDNPIRSKVGTDFYARSPYGAGTNWEEPKKSPKVPDGYEIDPKTGKLRRKSLKKRFEEMNLQDSGWDKLQRDSALRRGMQEVKKAKPVEGNYDESSYIS